MFLRNQLLKRINEYWYLEKIFNAALENDSYFLVYLTLNGVALIVLNLNSLVNYNNNNWYHIIC